MQLETHSSAGYECIKNAIYLFKIGQINRFQASVTLQKMITSEIFQAPVNNISQIKKNLSQMLG